jgi:biopolymer transport protein ExbB
MLRSPYLPGKKGHENGSLTHKRGFRLLLAALAVWICLLAAPVCSQEPSAPAGEEASSSPLQIGSGAVGEGRLLSLLRQGGPMLIPLFVCSFLVFLFVFERSISLRHGRIIPKPFVRRMIHQLEAEELDRYEAMELCEENRSPVATVFAAGVMKWGRPAVEVEQAIIDAGERVANGLRRYLRLFNGIATISPLFGLLGTVTGMIRAFNVIAAADAMGRPELLASGIAEALLTTAVGLTVAIPALIAYLYFASRVDKLVIEIDRLGQHVVNAVACDGWKDRPARKSKPRTKAA